MDASEAKKILSALPASWGPRREQPSWDRDFSGSAEIQSNLQAFTDKMQNWLREANAFSQVIQGGYSDDKDGLAKVGRDSRAILKQHAAKNGK